MQAMAIGLKVLGRHTRLQWDFNFIYTEESLKLKDQLQFYQQWPELEIKLP